CSCLARLGFRVSCCLLLLFFFFFFQAEDGIRDWSVTGVQTCALPISGNGFTITVEVPKMVSHYFSGSSGQSTTSVEGYRCEGLAQAFSGCLTVLGEACRDTPQTRD